MDDERRYSEDEVRRILELATRAEASARPDTPAAGGLTLADLREIAGEVGIPAPLVTRAAKELDRRDPGTTTGGALAAPPGARLHPRVLGLPLGAEHEVRLPRNPTDEEWGSLVLDLRRTFAAGGRAESVGSVREWRNGNLHVAVAPEGDGARMTMGTQKGSFRQMAVASSFLLTFAVVLLVVMVLTGEIAEAGAIGAPAILGGIGLGLLGVNAVALPSWAGRRARQFEEIGERALALTEGDPPGL